MPSALTAAALRKTISKAHMYARDLCRRGSTSCLFLRRSTPSHEKSFFGSHHYNTYLLRPLCGGSEKCRCGGREHFGELHVGRNGRTPALRRLKEREESISWIFFCLFSSRQFTFLYHHFHITPGLFGWIGLLHCWLPQPLLAAPHTGLHCLLMLKIANISINRY